MEYLIYDNYYNNINSHSLFTEISNKTLIRANIGLYVISRYGVGNIQT